MGYTRKKHRDREKELPRLGKPGGHGVRKFAVKPQHYMFFQKYVELNSISKAAKAVKVNPRTAEDWLRHPALQFILNDMKEEVRKKLGYTIELAMMEAEEAKQFAVEMKNAAAMVKAVELKSKLSGLIDKPDNKANATNFQIIIDGVRGQASITAGESMPALPNKVREVNAAEMEIEALLGPTEAEKTLEELGI